MFEVTLADGRTVLAAAYGPEDLALILRGTGAHIDVHEKITDPNAHIFKTNEAVTMRQALRITALEALVAKQNESKHLDGLNSDFAALHERLMGALTISLADRVVAAGAVFALMRIQNALNSSPKWDADTLDAVAAQVRAAGLPLLDADDASLDAEGLEEKYSPTGGGEHPLFKREDWRTAVNSDDTLLGYWGWLVNQLNQE